MIYFENYVKGKVGLSNQLMSYTLCVSLSNLLEREFFFDYDLPSNTPPDYAVTSDLREKYKIIMNSQRSAVSELVQMPHRRCRDINRQTPNKIRFDGIFDKFMTTRAQQSKYENTVIWNQFGLGRAPLIKEDLEEFELIEIGDHNLVNVTYFYFLPKNDKKILLDGVKIKYNEDMERLSEKISRELSAFNALHIRMGDFTKVFGRDGYGIKIEEFVKCLDANLTDKTMPVLVATDGLHEKDLFAELLRGYRYIFIDELIFDEYQKEFSELQFTDFNALSIINQLLCAASESFIGTCRSTFTNIIHRLRQERYDKTDFNFMPDDRINKLLTPDFKLSPDRQGFFEWNRYSVFTEYYFLPGWMREWNYDLTSLAF